VEASVGTKVEDTATTEQRTGRVETMRAAVRDRFGSPAEVVQLREVEKPEPGDGDVLVRVRAASLNRADWYDVTGRPYVARPRTGLRRPKSERLGIDYAGTVVAVGANVTEFRPGDEVFGGRNGAFAEYVCARADRGIALKPANVTFEQAATVAVGGVTALQGLRDKGGLQPGQKVLVNGASGGVGTYTVQIAKALGADVTGVCSTRNVELARSFGADDVVDYTYEDFTRRGERYDLLLDVAGSRSWRECTRVLTPDATVVIVGAPKGGRFLGPLGHVIRTRLASLPSSRKVVFFIARLVKPDLETLRELLEAGKLRPAIERQYPLDEIGDALEYLGEGHCRSKVVVTM
jgi:NADPH:quinone reductase-like Zn-dependent oxidoreductase